MCDLRDKHRRILMVALIISGFIFPNLVQARAASIEWGEGRGGDCYVTPASLDFDVEYIGDSEAKTFRIYNTGLTTLNGTIDLPIGTDFSISPRNYSIPPGINQYVEITVSYYPSDCGNDNYIIDSENGCGTVSCSATGPGPADGEFTPSNLILEAPVIGHLAFDTFTLENTGCESMTVQASTDCGSEWSVSPATPVLINPGSNSEFGVFYIPEDCGDDYCTIEFTGDWAGGFECWGQGPSEGHCDYTGTPLVFGELPIGTSDTQTFTVTNDGCESFLFLANVESGSEEWEIISPLFVLPLDPGESRDVEIAYTPSDCGADVAQISVSGFCDLVECTGSGDAPLTCDVSPTNLEFSVSEVGQYQTKTVTVSNLGCVTYSFDPTENCGSEWNVSPSGNIELSPGESQILDVTYSPLDCGDDGCSISLSAFDSPCDHISCTATGPTEIICEVSPSNLDFTVTEIGQSQTKQVTVSNQGCSTYSIDPDEICGAEWSVSPSNSIELEPGGSQVLDITYSPLDCGDDECSISLSPLDTPCDHISCTATGPNQPACDVSPGIIELYLETPHEGSDEMDMFTISNEGCTQLTGDVLLPSGSPGGGHDWNYYFTLIPDHYDLAPGESQNIILYWTPNDFGGPFLFTIDTGTGCMNVDVGATTPTFLLQSQINGFPGRVELNWEISELPANLDFQVTASDGVSDWEIPWTGDEVRGYQALDESPDLAKGGLFDYQVDIRADGNEWIMLWTESVELDAVQSATGILGAYPNPFNPHTSIHFTLKSDTKVSWDIMDIAGRRVKGFSAATYTKGLNEIIWEGRDDQGRLVSSGIYFAQMKVHGYSEVVKLILLR